MDKVYCKNNFEMIHFTSINLLFDDIKCNSRLVNLVSQQADSQYSLRVVQLRDTFEKSLKVRIIIKGLKKDNVYLSLPRNILFTFNFAQF